MIAGTGARMGAQDIAVSHESCSTCRCWSRRYQVDPGGMMGECRVSHPTAPPTPDQWGTFRRVFPATHPTDWCTYYANVEFCGRVEP